MNDTKSNILKAVLEYISNSGNHKITIREISRIANVNSAAISYYFGSKDALIQEASKQYYIIGDEIFKELLMKKYEPRENLKHFFVKYTNHMIKYSGFLKVQLSMYLKNEALQPHVEKSIEDNLRIIANAIGEISGEKNEEKLYFKAIQFISSIVYPYILNKYSNIDKTGFIDESTREKYINSFIECL